MSATPVLLLHAFPFDSRMWQGATDALSVDRPVLAPDLRGFGAAARGVPPTSIAQHARDVLALLDTAGVARAIVVGLSMGGYVALALHEFAAHRIAGLALADTNAHADSPESRAERDTLVARIEREGLGFFPDLWIDRLVGARCPTEVRASLRAMILEQPPRAVIAGLRAIRDRRDQGARLGAIGVPTTIVCGAEDRLTPPASMERMARAIPGARMRVIEGAGHLASLEAPDAFRLVLEELVASVDAAG